jgi:RNA polymerase sigma factor (sigma-70 family)
MMTASEQENINQLVSACAEGDEVALKTFFDIYSMDIYNFPVRVFHLTEDDAGEFFIFAFERLRSGKRFQSFKGKSSFKTWLYTVLRNLLLDWKRNRKELKIVSTRKRDSEGREYGGIDEEPDVYPEQKEKAEEFREFFNNILSEIKIESRVLFKIAFIYYLNLEEEEIQYILSKTNYTRVELQLKILEIREHLANKELDSLESEEKITAIYTQIQDLKEIRRKEENRVFDDNLPNKDKIEVAIQKKYEQREKLLTKKGKGLFLTRTPYKMIIDLLKIPEGGISITLQRVSEKIQKKLEEAEI